MSRPRRPAGLPVKDGVSPSCVVLASGPWELLVAFLAQRLPVVSIEQWRQRMAGGEVLDETGQALAPEVGCQALRHRLGPHPRIYYYRSLEQEAQIPGEVVVVFQDELLVVADKPHFLPVTPGGRFIKQSLLVRLKQALGLPELSPVHRIDRETSGLVLLSVRASDRSRYQALFEQRQVHKTYEAVAPLSADPLPPSYQSRIVPDAQFFRQREAAGEPNSLTRILGVTPLPCNDTPARGLYQLQPVTGKTHQLRVHLNALGRPIVNDLFYPAVVQGPGQADDYSRPLQLCARSLAFEDPVTGQERVFKSQRVLELASAFALPASSA